MSNGRGLPPPPDRQSVRRNIDTPTREGGTTRYLNCRIPNDQFKEIKKAALEEDMNLSEYILLIHASYQRNR